MSFAPAGSPRTWPTGSADRPRPLLELFSGPGAWAVVVGASALLGLAMSRSGTLATIHLLATLLAVGAAALFARSPAIILALTVYAGTCDVLWRSAEARGPYEGAKYALVIGFGCLAVRFLRRPRNLGLCSAIVVLLIPGAIAGMMVLGVVGARQYIIANLAGVVALALGALVCSNLRLSSAEVRGVYLLALSPAVSVAAIATTGTLEAGSLDFGDQSNFAAAGGFGPVQVSSVLCFGVLLCVLVFLQPTAGWLLRVLTLVTATWLVGQAVLTFSRGGVFSLVVALACVGLVALTLAGQRTRSVVAAGVLVVVAIQILSWAGTFTDNASEERFSSTDTTNRTELARADLELFYAHPLGGVGVGEAAVQRDFPVQAAPHTEYTRLLAEHGMFGVGVLVLLALLSLRIIRSGEGWYRMAAVGLIVMSLAQMTHSATRIGSIALAFALAALLEEKMVGGSASTASAEGDRTATQ